MERPSLLRRLATPRATPYTAAEWTAQPWPARLRMACLAWAMDGYGSPVAIYALYGLKVLFYVGAWVGFVALGESGGGWVMGVMGVGVILSAAERGCCVARNATCVAGPRRRPRRRAWSTRAARSATQ